MRAVPRLAPRFLFPLLLVAASFAGCDAVEGDDPIDQADANCSVDPGGCVVEELPEMIGGLASIQDEIVYPEQAKRDGVEGRVFVQFIVTEEGNVAEPVVFRGIGAGCDEEALRVVRLAKFKPGKQRGVPVRVKMSLPITFKLR